LRVAHTTVDELWHFEYDPQGLRLVVSALCVRFSKLRVSQFDMHAEDKEEESESDLNKKDREDLDNDETGDDINAGHDKWQG
jgi:hypothetical protein